MATTVRARVHVTQTRPSPYAADEGPSSTATVWTTRLVVGSIRATEPDRDCVTHSDPPPSTIPVGAPSTGITSWTAWLAASTRDTSLPSGLVSQASPACTAM